MGRRQRHGPHRMSSPTATARALHAVEAFAKLADTMTAEAEELIRKANALLDRHHAAIMDAREAALAAVEELAGTLTIPTEDTETLLRLAAIGETTPAGQSIATLLSTPTWLKVAEAGR